MKKKNIVICSAAAAVVILILSMYGFMGYVPFYGKSKAEKEVNLYLKNPAEKIIMNFDFYNGGGYVGGNCRYNLKTGIIFDAAYNEDNQKINAENIKSAVNSFPSSIKVDDYHIMSSFDCKNSFKKLDKLVIYKMKIDEELSEIEGREKCVSAVMDIINSENMTEYNFCELNITCSDRNNTFSISCKSDAPLTEQEIRNSIKTI